MKKELFKSPKAKPIYQKCDCKKKMVGGKEIMAPQNEQPVVLMQQSFDYRYLVGRCGKCKKTHHLSVSGL